MCLVARAFRAGGVKGRGLRRGSTLPSHVAVDVILFCIWASQHTCACRGHWHSREDGMRQPQHTSQEVTSFSTMLQVAGERGLSMERSGPMRVTMLDRCSATNAWA